MVTISFSCSNTPGFALGVGPGFPYWGYGKNTSAMNVMGKFANMRATARLKRGAHKTPHRIHA